MSDTRMPPEHGYSDADEPGYGDDDAEYGVPRRVRRRRKKKKKRGGSFFAVIISLGIFGGLAFGVIQFGSSLLDNVTGFFGPPEDYSGPGSGEVTVTIEPGSSLQTMGDVLHDAGVVASADAFIDAADGETIQAGVYTLKEEMKASDAVEVMIEGATVLSEVAIPEGLRVRQALERIAENSDFKVKELQAALDDLELPAYAGENAPEGFLFPATYPIQPDTTPASLLENMVNRYGTAMDDTTMLKKAKSAGLEPLEALTVASIIQREVRDEDDMPGVAEVIFNRLGDKCDEVPDRLLQMDSTVHYALDKYGDVTTTDKQRQVKSPYNTYRNGGLPPGPIASPGEAAINAVFNPTDKGWCYFRLVDAETGETKFSRTSEEHNQ